MFILVFNSGSSSIKYDLINVENEKSLCKGSLERIGEVKSFLNYQITGKEQIKQDIKCLTHHDAIEIIKNMLLDPINGVISNVNDVMGVGHRMVHGGEKFSESIIINDKILNDIEEFSHLAPLHNPPALEGIKSCIKIFKNIPQVVVFDTAFHQSMPEYVFSYGIDYKYYEKYGIRKYGFHGTSHKYVAMKAAEELKKPFTELNAISVHLGNGCSICAINKGKSIDTSMGFTPLEGLIMGTRCGDIDPTVITFLMEKEKLSIEQIERILNKKSGLLGLSGISNDMRDIISECKKNNKRAQLAFNAFLYRIKKYIGSYIAILVNVDAIIFTGGIGENVKDIKNNIEKQLFSLLKEKTKFFIIKTNEELMIAKETHKVIEDLKYVKIK